jgi:prepilin-type N-terminal cleavage/methylation domain-containing protein
MLMDLRKDRAFTLIELLIVIAIVGILAAVALAYYRSQYIGKARLSEVTSSMSLVASSVARYYTDSNVLPTASDVVAIQNSLEVAVPVGRISAMDVTRGVITATIANIDPIMDGKKLVLTPSTDLYGAISWTWSGTVPSVYIPRRH